MVVSLGHVVKEKSDSMRIKEVESKTKGGFCFQGVIFLSQKETLSLLRIIFRIMSTVSIPLGFCFMLIVLIIWIKISSYY